MMRRHSESMEVMAVVDDYDGRDSGDNDDEE